MVKTVTEDRREFIKNNNIIVKVNNYDEACDAVDIIAESIGVKLNHIFFMLMDIVGDSFNQQYLVKKIKKSEILVTKDISKYKDSKEIYHEFPTRNFIDAFID